MKRLTEDIGHWFDPRAARGALALHAARLKTSSCGFRTCSGKNLALSLRFIGEPVTMYPIAHSFALSSNPSRNLGLPTGVDLIRERVLPKP
jgi:hypothetical protein